MISARTKSKGNINLKIKIVAVKKVYLFINDIKKINCYCRKNKLFINEYEYVDQLM